MHGEATWPSADAPPAGRARAGERLRPRPASGGSRTAVYQTGGLGPLSHVAVHTAPGTIAGRDLLLAARRPCSGVGKERDNGAGRPVNDARRRRPGRAAGRPSPRSRGRAPRLPRSARASGRDVADRRVPSRRVGRQVRSCRGHDDPARRGFAAHVG
jgi:hypothetical protein